MASIACKHPPLPKTGTRPTWVTDTEPKGLPPFTECVARAIFHTGRSQGDVSKAVELAMGRVEDWAKGVGSPSAETAAKAQADVKILRAKLAQTAGKRAASLSLVDLATAFDETKHKRIPKGSPGGGRFTALVSHLLALREGESHTVHAASGTRVKKLTATRYRVEQGGSSHVTGSAHDAARRAVRMARAAKAVKRTGRPGVTNLTKGALPPKTPGGKPRFPITNHAAVKKAVKAVGRARPKTPQERAKVRRHIIAQAKRIGASHLIPQSWNSDGTLSMSVTVTGSTSQQPVTVNALLRRPGNVRSRGRMAAAAVVATKRVRRKQLA